MTLSNKNRKWIYVIIAILAVTVAVETAILFKSKICASGKPCMGKILSGHNRTFSKSPSSLSSRQKALLRQGAVSGPFSDEWNPFLEMRAMQNMMNKMFEESFFRGYSSPAMQSFSAGFQASGFSPSVDLKETDASYIVTADIPGTAKDKINVSVRNGMLTLSGERLSEEERTGEGFYSQERSYGSFSRTIPLPGPVDENNIKAEYTNGVLTVTLPKLAEAAEKGKRVTVA